MRAFAFKKKIWPVCIRRFIRGKCVEELSTCGWISSTHTKVWVGNIEKKRERERDTLSCRVKTSVRCKSSRQLLSSFILKWREIKDSWVLRTKPWKSERFLTLIRRNAPRKKMCVHRRKKNLFNRDWFLPRPPSLCHRDADGSVLDVTPPNWRVAVTKKGTFSSIISHLLSYTHSKGGLHWYPGRNTHTHTKGGLGQHSSHFLYEKSQAARHDYNQSPKDDDIVSFTLSF